MGPEPSLDAKTSPAKTTRSRTEMECGIETAGVCAKAFKTSALFPLTRPTSLEMCYLSIYSSTNFFLCLGGFRRLSGITRPAGGGPANSRARRLASPLAVNFFGLVLDLLRLMNDSDPTVLKWRRWPREPSYHFIGALQRL
jgi:hypothetical protein